MTRIILTIALTIISYSLSFSQEETSSITINFIGIKSDKGKMYVALYKGKDNFLKKPFKKMIAPINGLKSVAVFNDIPKGFYAVSCYQDENNNGKMDTNFIGMPKEPIGTSNDAKGFMGPPKYKDAKFEADKDITLKITVKKIF